MAGSPCRIFLAVVLSQSVTIANEDTPGVKPSGSCMGMVYFGSCEEYIKHGYCSACVASPQWNTDWGTADGVAADIISAADTCCLCCRTASRRLLQVKGAAAESICVDLAGWEDSYGDDCTTYDRSAWCSGGGVGPAWDPSSGSFSDYAVGGVSAADACCACGGGKIDSSGDSAPSTIPPLRPGNLVRVEGLRLAQLNGLQGELLRLDSMSGRWEVNMPGGDVKSIKPANLVFAAEGSANDGSSLRGGTTSPRPTAMAELDPAKIQISQAALSTAMWQLVCQKKLDNPTTPEAIERVGWRVPIQPDGNAEGRQYYEHAVDDSGDHLFDDVTVHIPWGIEGRADLLRKLTAPSASIVDLDNELYAAGRLSDLHHEHNLAASSDEQFKETWAISMKYFRAIERHLRNAGLSPQKYDLLMGFSGTRKQSYGFPQYHVDSPHLEGLFEFLETLRNFTWAEKYHPMAMSRWNDELQRTELFFDAPILDPHGRHQISEIGPYLREIEEEKRLKVFAQFNTWFVVSGLRKLQHYSSFENMLLQQQLQEKNQTHLRLTPEVYVFGGNKLEQEEKFKILMFSAWARTHRGMPVDELREGERQKLGWRFAWEVEAVERAIQAGRSREMRFAVIERLSPGAQVLTL